MRFACLSGVVLAVVLPAGAFAQSGQPDLAAIARQAEAAKPTAPKAKKTYTNSDLRGGGLVPPPSPAADAAKTSANVSPPAVPAKPVEAQPAAEEQVEEVWRRRADRFRDQVKNLQARLAALTSRPPNPNANLQQRADKEIGGIRSDLVRLRLQWTQLELEARTAKVNILWIEPRPAFPQ